MAEFPALPLWTDGYLADTRHLSTVEHGAYLLLLMEAWRRPSCSLPADDKFLSRLAGVSMAEWLDMKDIILAFWKLNERTQTITQKRLTKERQFLDKKRDENRVKALTRWKKTKSSDADAMPDAMPEACRDDAPTPTPTPNKKKAPSSPKKGSRLPDNFKPDQEWSKAQGLSTDRLLAEFEKFKDYWRGAAGAKGVKLDWQATWRNWIRAAIERSGGRAPPAKKSEFRTQQDDITANLERMANGQSTGTDEQPALDLDATDYRRH